VSDEFFESPPPQPELEAFRQPDWMGPPDNEVGELVPIGFVLVRTVELAVAVRNVTAFSKGFSFDLAIRRRVSPKQHDDPFGRMHRGPAPDALRFGVQFSDGSKATTYGHSAWAHGAGGDAPAGPILTPRGGSGGDRSWDMGMWVWPLPPPGALAFVAEWPAQAIELTRHEVDAETILKASARVEQLWPDDHGPSSSGGWTSQQIVARAKRPPA
jgi:hypothetical protein